MKVLTEDEIAAGIAEGQHRVAVSFRGGLQRGVAVRTLPNRQFRAYFEALANGDEATLVELLTGLRADEVDLLAEEGIVAICQIGHDLNFKAAAAKLERDTAASQRLLPLYRQHAEAVSAAAMELVEQALTPKLAALEARVRTASGSASSSAPASPSASATSSSSTNPTPGAASCSPSSADATPKPPSPT